MSDEAMTEAIASENAIAAEATAIRGEATELTPELFFKLYPLLCRPIPKAFIQTVPPTKGKPYESTGIRSVQVQINRMNAVLTPLWWADRTEYHEDGKLARVEVMVGNGTPMLTRSSWGGVGQASNAGNLRKGSYTNAAKLAFARIGVGAEVYVGATDLDPDVDRDLAEQAEGKSEPSTIGKEIAKKMVTRAFSNPKAKAQLQLAASHVVESDIGDCSTVAKATASLAALSFSQAERVDNWIEKKLAETDE